MSNVVYFPAGRYWRGGRGRKRKEDLLVLLSSEDYQRLVAWEVRNAAWFAAQRRHGGDKQQGGAA